MLLCHQIQLTETCIVVPDGISHHTHKQLVSNDVNMQAPGQAV